jgi:hypothetical protein
MTALDWIRVFGPLGSEDRDEDEPDGPSWGLPHPVPTTPPPRPPGEAAGVDALSLSQLLDELVPVAPRPPSRRLGSRHRHRSRPRSIHRATAIADTAAAMPLEPVPGRGARARRWWTPALAAVAVISVPAAASVGGRAFDRPNPATPASGVGVDYGTPSGTTAAPGN